MNTTTDCIPLKKFILLFTAAALIMSIPAFSETKDSAETKESAPTTSIELASLQLDPPDSLAVAPFTLSLDSKNSGTFKSPAAPSILTATKTLKAYPRFTPTVKSTASAGDYLFATSMVATAVLNVADYVTTTKALKYPALQEGNPLMKPFVGKPAAFAAVKIGLSTVSFIVLRKLYKKNRAAAWVLSTVTNAALSFIVANNLRLIDACENGCLSGY